MKKKGIILCLLVIILTGCTVVRIDTSSIDNMVNVVLSKNNTLSINFLNHVENVYEFIDKRNEILKERTVIELLEMLINYFFFEKKKKDVPLYLIFIYIIINIILGIIPYTNIIDILPIICATLYCVTIACKKESNIRKLMFLNQVFWLTVDLKYKAYMFAISNILTLISIIISMYRYDYKKGKK